MSIDERSFRKALGSFGSGVTVVTARDSDGSPAGVTVSAFASVSLDPPLILINLAEKTSRLGAFLTGPFAVHLLAADQRDVSIRFASRSDTRWEGFAWTPSDDGVPLFSGCAARLLCAVEKVIEAGDHRIVVGRVTSAETDGSKLPLLYWRGAYHGLTDAL